MSYIIEYTSLTGKRVPMMHKVFENADAAKTHAAKNVATGNYKSYLIKNLNEGWSELPPINREKYQSRRGLEGPIQTKSGKTVYYDPKAGKYYDPDTDMYMSYDEWRSLDEGVCESVEALKQIVADKSAAKVHGVMVDMFTASAIMQVYDAVSDKNKASMEQMLNSKAGLMKMADFAMKQINEWGGDDQYEASERAIENALSTFEEMLDSGEDELRARAEAHDYLKGELGDLGVRHGDLESKKYHGELEKEIIDIMNRRDKGIREGEEKPYICVHAKKGKHECHAGSSYEAAKKAAAHWKMKSTAGIDAHLAVEEGCSPHKKGSAKYKKHMAAKHAAMGESTLSERSEFEKYRNMRVVYDPETLEIKKAYPMTNRLQSQQDADKLGLVATDGHKYLELRRDMKAIKEDKIELALRGPKNAKISHNGEQYTNFEMMNKFRAASQYGDVIRFSCTRLRDGNRCEMDIAGDHVLKVTCDSDSSNEYAAMNVKTGDYADYYTRDDIIDERNRFTHVMTQAKFDDFESKHSVEDMVGLSDNELKKFGWRPLKFKTNESEVFVESVADEAAHMERDHEVQMARSDLYKIANYAVKLHKMLKNVSEEEGIQGWMQAKITKAADYMSSVAHTLEYDMMEKHQSEPMAEGLDASKYHCKDCGCQMHNCKPECDCEHDSHDEKGSWWVDADGNGVPDAFESVEETTSAGGVATVAKPGHNMKAQQKSLSKITKALAKKK